VRVLASVMHVTWSIQFFGEPSADDIQQFGKGFACTALVQKGDQGINAARRVCMWGRGAQADNAHALKHTITCDLWNAG
jgi:hypothetical protein